MSAAFITWELSRTTPHSNCPQKKTKDIPGSGSGTLVREAKEVQRIMWADTKAKKKMPKRESPG